MRYLVWDDGHDRLFGILALGDPVFNLSVRDAQIGWNSRDREQRLVNVLDAYVLGAVPPYNILLGGKAVACLVRSKEIYDDFRKSYGGSEGVISGDCKRARLLAVTTSSSLGRSSVYNRLALDGIKYFESIGFTEGWGHFHIPDRLFGQMREFLRECEHPYSDNHGFGQGPNWRFRTIRAALTQLGFDEALLRHGVQREVFLCLLARNAANILRTGKGRPDISSLLSVSEISDLCLDRWIAPRAARRPDFRNWRRHDIVQLVNKGAIGRAAPLAA